MTHVLWLPSAPRILTSDKYVTCKLFLVLYQLDFIIGSHTLDTVFFKLHTGLHLAIPSTSVPQTTPTAVELRTAWVHKLWESHVLKCDLYLPIGAGPF